MKIKDKDVYSKITISSIARFASSKGVAMKRLDSFLDNITTDELFGLFISGAHGASVSIDDMYEAWDANPEFIAEISEYIQDQLAPKNQAVVKD